MNVRAPTIVADTRLHIARPTVMVVDRFSNDGQYGYNRKCWIYKPGEAS